MHKSSESRDLRGGIDASESDVVNQLLGPRAPINSRPPYLALPRGLTGFDVMALGSIAQLAHEDANVVRDIQACLIAMRDVNCFGQIATRHMTRRGTGRLNEDDLSQARAAFARVAASAIRATSMLDQQIFEGAHKPIDSEVTS